MTLLGQMTDGQYWKWKHLLLEIEKAKIERGAEELRVYIQDKDLEIMKLNVAINKLKLQHRVDKVGQAEQAYKEGQKALSEELGFSFENCSVNEATLEVYKLD